MALSDTRGHSRDSSLVTLITSPYSILNDQSDLNFIAPLYQSVKIVNKISSNMLGKCKEILSKL